MALPDRQVTLLELLHDAVSQGEPDSAALAVASSTPKLNPRTVTDALPVSGAFWPPDDAAGESYDIGAKAVPATAPTVTIQWSEGPREMAVQESDVEDDQLNEPHVPMLVLAEGVKDTPPKLSPSTATFATVERGVLRGESSEAQGASKLR